MHTSGYQSIFVRAETLYSLYLILQVVQLLIVARDNESTPSDVKEVVEKSIVSWETATCSSMSHFFLWCKIPLGIGLITVIPYHKHSISTCISSSVFCPAIILAVVMVARVTSFIVYLPLL